MRLSTSGRLGKGTAQPGKTAPWTLAAPTESDREVGKKYLVYAEAQKAETEAPF